LSRRHERLCFAPHFFPGAAAYLATDRSEIIANGLDVALQPRGDLIQEHSGKSQGEDFIAASGSVAR
jgi:hypothetical protein